MSICQWKALKESKNIYNDININILKWIVSNHSIGAVKRFKQAESNLISWRHFVYKSYQYNIKRQKYKNHSQK